MNRLKLIILCLPFVTIGQNINYSEDIAPIIYNKCLMCHHSGGIGPFSFETYSNTVSNIGMIQHVVSNGEMPPWPPDTNYQRYAYENILSSFEISLFTDWINDGVPIGDTSLLPTLPSFSNNNNLGVPDLEIQIPTYSSIASSNSDDYVCFSIPSGLINDRQVRAIEVVPGNPQIVHHVLVAIDEFGFSSGITQNCMAPTGDQVYTYAPGSKPMEFPTSQNNIFGIEIPSNSNINLGLHYPEGSFGQVDSTKVRFYFYPQNTTIREIYTDYLINEGLPPNPPFYIPPNQITQISSSFGPLSNDMSVMSIYPHMHMLGKEMECYAVTPTSDTINLIRINKWDFDWQGAYLFKKFIKIPAGSMIYATGSYDNTISASNPNPIMVQSGLNTDDEMFIFIFQYTDYQLGDENIFIEEQFNVSSTSNIADNFLKKIILKTNLLGKRSRSIKNNVSIFIHKDGEFEKKIIID